VERRRVEIAHESLLTQWPRLARWRAQDAEGAVLRDQLRQAAQLWSQRGRAEDFLWTGTAFGEYRLWRERYPGGLTALEEEFATAMTSLASRRRRRRRLAIAGVITALALGLGTFAVLWMRGEAARRAAEASKLLALGQVERAADPGAALAYALASLELNDSEFARLFAARVLAQGPPPRVSEDRTNAATLAFNPSGDRLAAGGYYGVEVHDRGGGPPLLFDEGLTAPLETRAVAFGPDGDLLAVRGASDRRRVDVWSLSAGRVVRSFLLDGGSEIRIREGQLYILSESAPQGVEGVVRRWRFGATQPERVGSWRIEAAVSLELDSSGKRLLYARRGGVYSRPLRDPPAEASEERLLGEHANDVVGVFADPLRPRLASGDGQGEVRVWSLENGVREALRALSARGRVGRVVFDPTGERIAVVYRDPFTSYHLWELEGPEGAEPLVLQRRQPATRVDGAAFTPDGSWFATHQGVLGKTLNFFPLAHRYPTVLRFTGSHGPWMEFTPDGGSLLLGVRGRGFEALELVSGRRHTLREAPDVRGPLAIDPNGRSFLSNVGGRAFLASTVDGSPRRLTAASEANVSIVTGFAFSRDGKRAAWVVLAADRKEDLGIQVLEVESGQVETLPASRGEAHGMTLAFARDGALYSCLTDAGGERSVFRWNPQTGRRVEVIKLRRDFDFAAITGDGRFLIAVECLSGDCGKDTYGNVSTRSVVWRFDLELGESKVLVSHGDRVAAVSVDSERRLLVTGSYDGAVRVGPLSGETPQVMFGHENAISMLALDPKGRWLASSAFNEPLVRLWPMPDLSQPPLTSLPLGALLAQLRSLTNLRVVRDDSSPTGYRLEVGPFPGWARMPQW
jgi:WD40 repeat protein